MIKGIKQLLKPLAMAALVAIIMIALNVVMLIVVPPQAASTQAPCVQSTPIPTAPATECVPRPQNCGASCAPGPINWCPALEEEQTNTTLLLIFVLIFVIGWVAFVEFLIHKGLMPGINKEGK